MNISIYERNQRMRERIKKQCVTIIQPLKIKLAFIETFHENDIILQAENIDLLIFDVEVLQVNGVTLKEKVQRLNHKIMFLGISDCGDLVNQEYERQGIGIVQKKQFEEQFPMRFLLMVGCFQQRIVERQKSLVHRITYIKTEGMYSIIHTEEGDRQVVRISNRQLEEELLNTNIIKTHRAYLVNMEYIEKIEQSYVQVKEKKIPVSTRRRKEVKERFADFCEK